MSPGGVFIMRLFIHNLCTHKMLTFFFTTVKLFKIFLQITRYSWIKNSAICKCSNFDRPDFRVISAAEIRHLLTIFDSQHFNFHQPATFLNTPNIWAKKLIHWHRKFLGFFMIKISIWGTVAEWWESFN